MQENDKMIPLLKLRKGRLSRKFICIICNIHYKALFYLNANVKGKLFKELLDSDVSNSFVALRLVKQLNLPVLTLKYTLLVRAADGTPLKCDAFTNLQLYKNVPKPSNYYNSNFQYTQPNFVQMVTSTTAIYFSCYINYSGIQPPITHVVSKGILLIL